MKLPNAARAFVDLQKLRDYCLSPSHPTGKFKARVFRSVLGLTQDDADELRDAVRSAAEVIEAVPGKHDGFGQRYTVDFLMVTASGSATVRSVWIVRRGEGFPRLVTCYVL